jgi:cell division protein FtsQ
VSAKRKISIRKVLQVFLGLAATGCCVTALLSAADIEKNVTITDVKVDITNGDKYKFMNEDMVKAIAITDRHVNIMYTPVKDLDIHRMEYILAANPWVASAQAYIDNKHVLHLNVTQRIPVARIFEDNGGSYYLDSSLSQMPISKQYTYYTTIVTNVPPMHDDSMSRAIKGEVVGLVKYVEGNSFWRAQIAQIAMDSSYAFQLVPVLGNHIILLGDTTDMQDKFANLLQFYKKIMNHIGWDKYERLDLRFKGQVVASPSLPYKGPVDKGMKTMSWYNSIMDSLRSKNDDGIAPVAIADTSKKTAAGTGSAAVKPQMITAPAKPPPVKVAVVAATRKLPAKKLPTPVHKIPDKQQISTVKEKYIYKRNNSTQTH